MRKITTSILSGIAIIVVFVPFLVSAHTTGASWEHTDGQYTVDIGYDPVLPTPGNSERFDFRLWRGATTTAIAAPYSQVWIRLILVKDNETLLATGLLNQSIGPTTLLYQFDQSGDYSLEASFRDADGNNIAVASFPISVAPQSAGPSPIAIISIVSLLIGAACGVGLPILYRTSIATRSKS